MVNRTLEKEKAKQLGYFKSSLSSGQQPKEEDGRRRQLCLTKSTLRKEAHTVESHGDRLACRDHTGYE